MIFGVGTDICDVRRVRAVWERRGARFAERVLGPSELQMLEARRARLEARGVSFLATRFSAKEAFSKAIGLGMHWPMSWRSCEILNLPSGQPQICLHGELAAWFNARQLTAHVSLTDENDYATSFVVVERKPTP